MIPENHNEIFDAVPYYPLVGMNGNASKIPWGDIVDDAIDLGCSFIPIIGGRVASTLKGWFHSWFGKGANTSKYTPTQQEADIIKKFTADLGKYVGTLQQQVEDLDGAGLDVNSFPQINVIIAKLAFLVQYHKTDNPQGLSAGAIEIRNNMVVLMTTEIINTISQYLGDSGLQTEFYNSNYNFTANTKADPLAIKMSTAMNVPYMAIRLKQNTAQSSTPVSNPVIVVPVTQTNTTPVVITPKTTTPVAKDNTTLWLIGGVAFTTLIAALLTPGKKIVKPKTTKK